MNSKHAVEIIGCHAEGEVGDVIVGGVEPPPGESIWDQSRWIARDDGLRRFVLNEPRGGVFRHVNLLVPAVNPDADIGFIIMEPCDTPPMSGSNSICVATVVLETGIVPMREPESELVLEAPGGLVRAYAKCHDGKVTSVRVHNLPSFVHKLEQQIDVDGIGAVTIDTAYGGDSFAIVDAAALGFQLVPQEARQLTEAGMKIVAAATEQIGFEHPTNPDWNHISFCLFAGAIENDGGDLKTRHAVAIRPGKIDRSPTGTGVSARLAVLHARQQIQLQQKLIASSIIDSTFLGRVEKETSLGDIRAIIPSIQGRAWTTGRAELWLDPDDPWPEGYRVADTWPGTD